MYKIEAVVKFNNREALVLDQMPIIKYEQYDDFLFGLDEYGVFCNSYEREQMTNNSEWNAFAGRKFEIPMRDGSFVKASGQWWSAGQYELGEKLGSEIIQITINDIESLRNCYVFTSCSADKNEYLKLRASYTGKIFEYWEYDCKLNGRCFQWNNDTRNPNRV